MGIEATVVTEKYTLYMADCLEVMRDMPAGSVDAVITDPPYIGLKGGISIKGNGVVERIEDSTSIGDPWDANLDWIPEAWRVCKYGMMVFCSHHFIGDLQKQLHDSVVGLVVWYKRNSPLPQNNVPHFNTEFIWLFKKEPGLIWKELETFYDIPLLQAGCFANERILKPNSGKAAHPAQKPELLMRRLLSATKKDMTIFDPFMGSGTTGVACMQLGRKFVGSDNNTKYFEIAEKRIRRAALQMPMDEYSAAKKQEEKQATLLTCREAQI